MAKTNSTAISKALRGRDKVDNKLLDQAVEQINRLHAQHSLELVISLGEYVLDAFFGGDPANLEAAKQHASWRALAARGDLAVSHSQLYYSVRILEQYRSLPKEVANALTVSHHRRLVGVRDLDARRRLAERAADKGMTVKQLEAAIAKQGNGSKGGRPRIPEHLKALRRLPKLVAPLAEHAVSVGDVELLGVEKMEKLEAELEEQLATLGEAKAEIARALKEYRERE